MVKGEKPTTIGELIEELKRLQIEHGNVPVYVKDSVLKTVEAWPEVEIIEISGKPDLAVFF